MNTKEILTKVVEVVSFLFAAFGGFLTKVAPPEEAESTFAVGISSFLVLAILLMISAVARRRKDGPIRIWFAVSALCFVLAIAAAFQYKRSLDRLTFPWPPESTAKAYIGGTVWTPGAQEYRAANPNKSVADIVADFGGIAYRQRVWTVDSIDDARMKITLYYVALVLFLATTIFCLTEGALAGPQPAAAPARALQSAGGQD